MGILSLYSAFSKLLFGSKSEKIKEELKSFERNRRAEEAVEKRDLGLRPVPVQEVHFIPGDFDILAKIVVERDLISSDSEAIGQFVQNWVRRIQGVAKTQTIIPLSSKHKDNPKV